MKAKICFVVSAPMTAQVFLKEHIKALSEKYEVYLVANLQGENNLNMEGLTDVCDIEIEREINLFADIKAILRLRSYFIKMKFDAIHSVTPKAGLLTAVAAKCAGIKNRIHIYTGQVWATKTGAFRRLLKTMDSLIGLLDNHILVDGEAQRQFLIKEGVVSEAKSRVLGAGSICGADTERFTPDDDVRKEQRKVLGVPDDCVVFSFMGRLNRDKGIYELLSAFNRVQDEAKNSYLLLFGLDEENCMSLLPQYKNIHEGVNFCYYGMTKTPQLSLQASDIFVLPSYREGFGLSVIEASSLGIPVICSDAYGLANTMIDDQTGLRCKVADVDSLQQAMLTLYNNPNLRKQLGDNGRRMVLENFSGEKIVSEWCKFYSKLLDA